MDGQEFLWLGHSLSRKDVLTRFEAKKRKLYDAAVTALRKVSHA